MLEQWFSHSPYTILKEIRIILRLANEIANYLKCEWKEAEEREVRLRMKWKEVKKTDCEQMNEMPQEKKTTKNSLNIKPFNEKRKTHIDSHHATIKLMNRQSAYMQFIICTNNTI